VSTEYQHVKFWNRRVIVGETKIWSILLLVLISAEAEPIPHGAAKVISLAWPDVWKCEYHLPMMYHYSGFLANTQYGSKRVIMEE
jgi:hypothetical protein